MEKDKVIQFFKNDHNKLLKIVNLLNEEKMIKDIIIGDWTVKDIISHISAWNWEIIKATNDVLDNKKPWYIDRNEMEFNKKEINKRKSFNLKEVINEWRNSYKALLEKIDVLTKDEWKYKSKYKWLNGSFVSVQSLYDYRYLGEGHEGGHAKQIKEYFKIED